MPTKALPPEALETQVYQLLGKHRRATPLWPSKPDDNKVTVVIPVLNESKRIASVVRLVLKSRRVAEVLVIDDGSIDGTPELAEAAGARVIQSTFLGKGASMQEGVMEAAHDTILFLDGDLAGLRNNVVDRMTLPILQGHCDFVKARFSRAAGRVTVLTARPLLRTYFPELAHFEQPLGGIIAARRELLGQLPFENDYGVDIGLLLDAAVFGARICEIDIGHIEHESHPLEFLGDMATQVARTILDRASAFGRLRRSFLQQTREIERLQRAHPDRVIARLGSVERLALFDMDGTLLNGRFIVELANRTGRREKLAQYLDRHDLSPQVRARRIARILAGISLEQFEATARALPLTKGAVETIVALRKRGYRVGIITDSYHIAAELVRRRVYADFALANVAEFRRGKATGIITLAPTFRAHRTGPRAYDKLNAVRFLKKRMGVETRNMLSVGDSENDLGMLRATGISFAFQPKSERVRRAAKHTVMDSLEEIIPFVDAHLKRRQSAY